MSASPPADSADRVGTATRRVLLVTAVAATLLLMLYGFGRRLIYFPAGAPPPIEDVLPIGDGVRIATADGLTLDAWFVPAGPVGVVVFPGNAGNRAGRAPLAQALSAEGLSVLLLDYRGFGGNPGAPSESGLLADGAAGAEWLRSRADIDRVVYFGESIGAAVAIGVALDRSPEALVLRSPFTSLVDVARVHYGPVPGWLVRDKFASIRTVDQVDAPVLVIVGERDDIVPPSQSRRLYEAASEPKRFVAIPDAGHNDPALSSGADLVNAAVTVLGDHGVMDGAAQDG